MSDLGAGSALLSFTCPRCSQQVTERLYGPCHDCREALVLAMAREEKDLEVAAYVPKSNVVANFVATKD